MTLQREDKIKLGLDQAILRLNRKYVPQMRDHAGAQLSYQLGDCYGCPLKKLAPISSNGNTQRQSLGDLQVPKLTPASAANDEALPVNGDDGLFIISTKHSLSHMELRGFDTTGNNNNQQLLCKIYGPFEAENKAEYAIVADTNSTNSQECYLRKLKDGPCDYCWFASIFGLILILSLMEILWARYGFCANKSKSRRRRLVYDASSSQPPKQVSTELKQVGSVASDEELDLGTKTDQVADLGSQEGAKTATAEQPINNANYINAENHIDASKTKRLDCLDAFRGLTISGMIMVNYGGAGYGCLEHAAWEGLTPADLVFPFFIFSMGASIGISIKSMLCRKQKPLRQVLIKIFRRSLVLLLIGLCLNTQILSYAGWQAVRVPGVLQRFAISYRLVAICFAFEVYSGTWIRNRTPFWGQRVLHLSAGRILELSLAIVCLTIYLFFSFFFQYDPNCPLGYFGPGGLTEGGMYANCTGGAAGWIDRTVLGESHLWRDTQIEEIFGTKLRHDPEGILGFTTSILLTLVGLSCGLILVDHKSSPKRKIALLGKWLFCMSATCILVIWIPIIKNLWSLTFVGASGACAIICISILYIIMDVCQCHRGLLLSLWQSAGKNSLLLYIGHSLIHKMMPWWFPVDETSHPALLGQLLWSTFVWLLFAKWLDNNKLYVIL